MTGAELHVEGLRAAYRPGEPVVDGVDLTVPAGTLTALLGPSGCGKSTLLAVVAGLLTATGGDVRVGGRPVLGTPAERRPVGMVFQRPLLFGHLTVGDNVGFGLRMQGVPAPERRRRSAGMLELVGLGGFAPRRVTELSGGQEQRVALARALVPGPPVLLLDEPLAALDADLRSRMRDLVRCVQRELSTTMLFVTHDQVEAVEVADRVAVMLHGRIEAEGPPADFYRDPASLALARFFGGVNEIRGRREGTTFHCGPGALTVADRGPVGEGVLVIRPESVRLGGGPAGPNRLAGVVRDVRFRGDRLAVVTDVDGTAITAWVGPDLPVEPGERVHLQLPPGACRVLPDRAGWRPPDDDREGPTCVTGRPTSRSTGSS